MWEVLLWAIATVAAVRAGEVAVRAERAGVVNVTAEENRDRATALLQKIKQLQGGEQAVVITTQRAFTLIPHIGEQKPVKNPNEKGGPTTPSHEVEALPNLLQSPDHVDEGLESICNEVGRDARDTEQENSVQCAFGERNDQNTWLLGVRPTQLQRQIRKTMHSAGSGFENERNQKVNLLLEKAGLELQRKARNICTDSLGDEPDEVCQETWILHEPGRQGVQREDTNADEFAFSDTGQERSSQEHQARNADDVLLASLEDLAQEQHRK